MSSVEKSNNSIEKSKSSNLEGTPSSGVNRFHKGEDELAMDYRKFLQKEDKKDLKKIKEGTYEYDASKWKPRVSSKYRLPLTPSTPEDTPPQIGINDQRKFSPHTPEDTPPQIGVNQGRKFSPHTPEDTPPTNVVKTAIIIPFRDSEKSKPRTKQLNKLVDYMASYLSGHSYKIFVIEQSEDGNKFNRGQLLNIGFELASNEGYYNFIFHDVDLLPSAELKKYYTNVPQNEPVHIASVWDRYNKNPDYFGGIVAFNGHMFQKINGYPNNFWGWGGEDDELYKRTKKFYDIQKVHEGSIKDLEQLNLQQKLEYLKENDLKFMKKREALAQHDATWRTNGLSNLNIKILKTETCGPNCKLIEVELTTTDSTEQLATPGQALDKTAPQELFREEMQGEIVEDKKITKPEAFDNLVKKYFSLSPFIKSNKNYELEIRFGTKNLKTYTKNDYDNVVKFLSSFGFTTTNPSGLSSLRIKCEFIDSVSGRFKMSDVRTEINGLHNIENYCKNNDLKSIYKSQPLSVSFNNKKPYITDDKKILRPVDFDDFNFRVSLQSEENINVGIQNYIIENWRKSKKEIRYLNRVTFTHPDYPVLVDISIVKTGNKGKDKRGYSYIIPVYTIEESNVFNNKESYDIEIEIDNSKIGPGTKFQTPDQILVSIRKVIKYILSGIQGTMFPVSYPEQEEVIRDYMRMIWGDEYQPGRQVTSQNFIGPNSITLQLTNIAPLDENSNIPNIRKDFVVTDKADGQRHLMYVSKTGKIYLISTNMDVKFTGAKTINEDCFNTLFDGELISHDKNNKFINLYAAFDIYFNKNKDVRNYTFMLREEEEDMYKSRFYLLNKLSTIIKPISIMTTENTGENKKSVAELLKKYSKTINSGTTIRFVMKKFYPISKKQNIFDGCKTILENEKEGLFEYNTDGLIFTHSFYGVGSNSIGKAGPKTKITWDNSFKWKPPQYNTIDFLVTTTKKPNGEDIIKTIFEDGMSTNYVQNNEYKTIELRCGFSEKNDGYINPCQDIIDDNLPEYKPRFEDKQSNDYLPKRFYPTEPYNPNAGICNIMLNLDDSGAKQMYTKEGEAFGDNTIVEFSYNLDTPNEEWRWVPLRVRYDKTAKLRRGEKEYGNSYKVCNENWKSIHPTGRITEDMLMTGLGIPDISVSEDIYYNTPAGKMKTEGLKNFHNLYVKKLLISGASKQGDTLIDLACGKAGDLPKWISAKLSFVFGIDYSKDNLENRLDGACVRYLKSRKANKHVPYALFAHGNSENNIKDGTALLNDKAKQITAAIFGNGPKEADKIGKGVARQYGKGDGGFNVSSCQFAIHYFFRDPDSLRGFLKNVAECTKLNGYFIGTAYDGKLMFNELKKIKTNESIQIVEDGKKLWEVTKMYGNDSFDDDSSSIGYQIDVYQESINQYISEYLVNFDYLERLMEAYGFKLINREEANEMGLPEGSGLFSELFINMLDEIKRNKFKATLFGDAPNMTSFEKKISFLNRYFVYKKVRDVNVEKLQLELGEYQESIIQREKEETKKAVVVAKEEEIKLRPKVKKLSKKLLLVAATEAVDEEPPTKAIEEAIEKKNKTKQKETKQKETKKQKKLLIIESDEED